VHEARELAVVIMAAGKGTRMNNPDMAKVMYTVAGKPMVEHVVDLALAIGASRVVVITGWQKDSVIGHLRSTGKPVQCVVQEPQLGTGHAVLQAEATLSGFRGDVVVLSGDVPLLTRGTMESLLTEHRRAAACATVLTAVMEDPTGYGRMLRGAGGEVVGIVEQKDAAPAQREIREINSGIYVFEAGSLFAGLHRITPNNAQKEYYLTDVFSHLWANKMPVRAVIASDAREIQGVNTPAQLEEVRAVFEGRAGRGGQGEGRV
jgi:UDP-N-acetylglucosamine pyrophosphorylase